MNILNSNILLSLLSQGPMNPTWHLEMRDFYQSPQYDYCCKPWQVIDIGESNKDKDATTSLVVLKEGGEYSSSIPKVLIAYGSDTAEAVAASLARRLKVCRPRVLALNAVGAAGLLESKQFTHFLIICSTFGTGKPPNNASDFFRQDLGGKLSPELKYATLALGSSLYPDFCKAGKDIDAKMTES